MTGYPSGSSSFPYTEYLSAQGNNGVFYSVVNELNELGYYTMAIHPNTGEYYSRRDAYQCMGFDEIFFSEEIGSDYERKGWACSDQWLYEYLIEQYENRDQNMPFFSFVITMQNHGGYFPGYDEHSIKVLNSMESAEKESLSSYVNLMKESTVALQSLLDYFATVDRPVIVVMFGDHAPALSGFGFKQDFTKGEEDWFISRTTPGLVWNNYGLPEGEWESLSTYKLSSKVLEYAGLQMDEYFSYCLEDEVLSGVNNIYLYNGDLVKKDELPIEIQEKLTNLYVLQYDRMYGKRYSVGR